MFINKKNWNGEIVKRAEEVLNGETFQNLNSIAKEELFINLFQLLFQIEELNTQTKLQVINLFENAVNISNEYKTRVIYKWSDNISEV